ncbi:MAG: cupin domain-containing protein [Pseudomonadota bacterium]
MADRLARSARDIAERRSTVYPPPYDQTTKGRGKRALGNVFGLDQFGVNLTTLDPGAATALLHAHSAEDEFVYVLEGTPTLRTKRDGEAAEEQLMPGDCVGFKAGEGTAHALVNLTDAPVIILEVGSRRIDEDYATYPDADLAVVPDGSGQRRIIRKDGTPI